MFDIIVHLCMTVAIVSFIINPKKTLKFIKELYFPDEENCDYE